MGELGTPFQSAERWTGRPCGGGRPSTTVCGIHGLGGFLTRGGGREWGPGSEQKMRRQQQIVLIQIPIPNTIQYHSSPLTNSC